MGIRIIEEEGGAEHRQQAKDRLEESLRDESLSTGFALSLLATIDAEAGCRQLLLKTEDLGSVESRQDAIDVFASVFGDRHSGRVRALFARAITPTRPGFQHVDDAADDLPVVNSMRPMPTRWQ